MAHRAEVVNPPNPGGVEPQKASLEEAEDRARVPRARPRNRRAVKAVDRHRAEGTVAAEAVVAAAEAVVVEEWAEEEVRVVVEAEAAVVEVVVRQRTLPGILRLPSRCVQRSGASAIRFPPISHSSRQARVEVAEVVEEVLRASPVAGVGVEEGVAEAGAGAVGIEVVGVVEEGTRGVVIRVRVVKPSNLGRPGSS